MNILTRLESKIRRIKADRIAQSMKRDLRVSDFTIISQNCIGGVFYHDMGLPFQSPTINLVFKAPDLIPDRLFYRNHRLIDTINKWAVSGGEH